MIVPAQVVKPVLEACRKGLRSDEVVSRIDDAVRKLLAETSYSDLETEDDVRTEVQVVIEIVHDTMCSELEEEEEQAMAVFEQAYKRIDVDDFAEDAIEDWGDQAAYNKDPYAYHGVSRKDFM